MAVVAVQEYDGLPIVGLKAAINAFGFLDGLFHQVVIALNVRAARGADLHKRKLAPVSRTFFEEPLNGAEFFRDALRVIHAVQAATEKRRANAKLAKQTRALEMGKLERRHGVLGITRHANGDRTNQGVVAVPVDGEVLALNAGFERAVNGIEKVIAMRLQMEADQISAQQPVQQLTLPWADAEGLWIRPGDVPENG